MTWIERREDLEYELQIVVYGFAKQILEHVSAVLLSPTNQGKDDDTERVGDNAHGAGDGTGVNVDRDDRAGE